MREAVDTARFGRRPPKAQVAETEGFDLHASVVIGARDVVGRERLLRYVARPAVALDRVSELPDGRIAWRLKQPGGRGETHRIMEPMDFMARCGGADPTTAEAAGALPRGVRAELTMARTHGAAPIVVEALGPTRVLLGSARRHRHPLVLGTSSVHTRPEALAASLQRIRAIGEDLRRDGRV